MDHPTVNSTDDEIRHWIKRQGPVIPIVYVYLGEAISPDQPDIAKIDCQVDGWPVTRSKRTRGPLING